MPFETKGMEEYYYGQFRHAKRIRYLFLAWFFIPVLVNCFIILAESKNILTWNKKYMVFSCLLFL
jgi:hypothetical protein